jgi:4-hydroxy-tetrahydrodipicolinate synthase
MKGDFNPEEIRSWLCGPIAAAATPFTEDYALDLDALHGHVRFMIDHGLRTGQGALLMAAAGGEHPTLNVEERKAAMATAVEAAAGEVPVLTSIQHTDVRVIVALAEHAAKVGIQALQLGATYYYGATEGDVLRLFQMVADASDVPIMIYRVGALKEMSLDFLQRLAEIETVRVLKFGSTSPYEFARGVKTFGRDLVVIDNTSQHVWGHMLGTRGIISHISNFWPEYTVEIWQLLERGEYAAVQDKLIAFKWKWIEWRDKAMRVTGGEGPFIKAAMEAVGLRAGPPRLPSVRPPQEMLDELRVIFDAAGVPRAQVPA